MAYMGNNAPTGWFLCNGAAISRSSYSALFSAVGTSSGIGDGFTSFNVPDLRGVFLRGVNGARGGGLSDPDVGSRGSINGGNSGNAVGSYQTDIFGSHSHISPYGENTGSDGDYPWGYYGGNNLPGSSGTDGDNVWPYTSPTGGAETRPRNIYVNYIIKY